MNDFFFLPEHSESQRHEKEVMMNVAEGKILFVCVRERERERELFVHVFYCVTMCVCVLEQTLGSLKGIF